MTATASSPIRHQAGVLTRRYAACLWGDKASLLLLFGQAPLIGYFCTLVWGGIETDTETLRFILCLSAHWFGLIDACREIVKERAIFARERVFGLSVTGYVLSKLAVLGVVAVTQVVLLQFTVEWSLALHGPMLLQTLLLSLCALSGVGLGLLVSALAKTQERAVFAVPLLILPQILFSEFAVPRKYFGAVVDVVEKFMPVRWAYTAFQASAELSPKYGDVALGVLAQLGFVVVFLVGIAALLLPRRSQVQ